jgi:hypothetical protein
LSAAADALELGRAQAPAPEPTKVDGHCGSCGGIEFVIVERCDECGEEEQVERLRGTPAPPSTGAATGDPP